MKTKQKKRSCLPGVLGVILLPLLLLRPGAADNAPQTGEPAQTTEPPAVSLETEPDTTGAPEPTTAEQLVAEYAGNHGLSLSDWPESLIALLERNPETLEFVLEYPEKHDQEQEIDLSEYGNFDIMPLFLQWDTRWGYLLYGSDVAGITGCGPVCLSMVACYLTGDASYSPDRIIRFALENGYCVPGNGSAWTLISQGGQELGLSVAELPLVEQMVMENLNEGNPIICIMGPGDFTDSGHYIVLAGCEDGRIRINDPNSRERSDILWDWDRIESQIDNLWVLKKDA